MSALADVVTLPGTATPQKRHPFGIKVPRSPEWPPYRYVLVPGSKPDHVPGPNLFEKAINWLFGFTPSEVGDVQTLGNAVAKKLRELGIVVNEDTKAAYQSNLKYSHEILQYVQAIGRAVEHDLAVQHKQIADLRKREIHDVRSLQHVITRDRVTAKREAEKARAYAIKKSLANTRAYIAKHYAHKIDANYAWLKNRDVWFRDKVSKWWRTIYRKQITQIKAAANGWRIPFAGLWGTINGEIKPTVKLVAGARDWLKFFKHWEKRALEAFGVLKAAEVFEWLATEHKKAPAK